MTISAGLPGQTRPVAITATGSIDGAAHRLAMDMDMSNVAAAAGAAGQLGQMTLVEDGTIMYLRASYLSSILPAGKSWMKLDLSRLANGMGESFSALTSVQSDPRVSLQQLRKAGNVVELGPRSVRGVATTRYSVLLDVRAGLGRLDGAAKKLAEQMADRFEAAGHKYVPAYAWIDSSGYLRRFQMSVPDYLGAGTSFSVTADYFDFGGNVSIGVPPESTVADLTDAVGQAR
jgi:hypothetical protein